MRVLKSGSKYVLDFRFRDKRFRIVGFETQKHSGKLADTIERLMEIYYSNDTTPLEIQNSN